MSSRKPASSKSPRTRSAGSETSVQALRAVAERLQNHGVRPSAQRVAIASYVLGTDDHPSADQVWARVQTQFPMVSRATVYNTLRHFTEKGLLRELVLAEGRQVFDPKVEPHHHFVDDETGAIHDIPWGALRVGKVDELEGVEVREYMVVVRGVQRGQKRSQ
jgi:Fur family iron response transcriptional regulator